MFMKNVLSNFLLNFLNADDWFLNLFEFYFIKIIVTKPKSPYGKITNSMSFIIMSINKQIYTEYLDKLSIKLGILEVE